MGYRSVVVAAMSAALLAVGTVGVLPTPASALQASLTVSPTADEAGATVTLSGSCDPIPPLSPPASGSPPAPEYPGNVEIFFGDGSDPEEVDAFDVGPDGTFSGDYTVPATTPAGKYTFSTDCGEAQAPFEVLAPVDPSLQLVPVSGRPHDDVTATGTCPRSFSSVEIFFEDTVVSDSVDYATGGFGPVVFDVPEVPAGSYVVTTSCDGDAQFEVFPILVDPTLVLSPTSGEVGDGVSATGTCPVDSDNVEVYFEDTVVSDSVDPSTGAFGPVPFSVPEVDAGDYTVTTSCEGGASFQVLEPVLPSLELAPASGLGGTDVTATGTCPRYTEYVEIYFGDDVVTFTSVDYWTGAFGPVGFPVPDVPPAVYDVTTDCDGRASFEVLDVPPTLVLDPTSGPAGDGVTATGTCPRYSESPSGSVEIFFGDNSVGSATVDSATGGFDFTVAVPAVPPGSYVVTTDCGGEASFDVLFIDAVPTLSLDPTSGQVGDGVSATGTCPVDSGSVEIFFGGEPVDVATVDNSTGEFGLTFPVPDVPPGAYVVTTGCGAEAPFEVEPIPATLLLTPTSGRVGDSLTARGTCPVSSDPVEIFFGTSFVGYVSVDPSTGEFGPVGFPVPDVPPGFYDVTTNCGGTAPFEVLEVLPTVELDPTSGQVGDAVTATGTCPVSSGSVQVFFDGTRVGSATVDSSTGEFGSVDFPVPDLSPGSYGVTTDCGGQASFVVLPDGVIPATLELDPARGELGIDVTANGTCPLDHPDVTLLLDGRTVATTGGHPKTGGFEIVFPMLGVEGPRHTVTTSCGASEGFTVIFPSPSATSPSPGTRAEPRTGGSSGSQGRPNRPRSQLPVPTPIETPQGLRMLVPDLTGLTEDEVIIALGDELTLDNPTGGVGVVIKQLPLAGTLVEPASAVSILLAEPELAPIESGTSRFPLAVLTVLVGALIGALLSGERVRRRRARERRWVDTDVRTELETAEPALKDVPDGSAPGLAVRLELQRDPKHL
jgi:hypothetical protein